MDVKTDFSFQNGNVPKDIKFDSIVVDLSFHPNKDIIAAGDIDGDITVYVQNIPADTRDLTRFFSV